MSYYGWRVVGYDFERRWTEAHQAGKVHVHERSRILAGDCRYIARELKPGFKIGDELVLSWTRATRQAVYDDYGRLTGDVVVAAKVPLFAITIRDVKRHRLGGFRVYFDVFDRRETKRLVRRKPPALRDGDYSEASVEEVAEAAVESAYTSNPKQALDHLEAVPANLQNVYSMQAQTRFADHKRAVRTEERTRQEVRSVTAQIRETAITLAKEGVDPQPFLIGVQGLIDAQRDQQKQAA